jgi:hypothetical protein
VGDGFQRGGEIWCTKTELATREKKVLWFNESVLRIVGKMNE